LSTGTLEPRRAAKDGRRSSGGDVESAQVFESLPRRRDPARTERYRVSDQNNEMCLDFFIWRDREPVRRSR